MYLDVTLPDDAAAMRLDKWLDKHMESIRNPTPRVRGIAPLNPIQTQSEQPMEEKDLEKEIQAKGANVARLSENCSCAQ